MTSRKYAWLVVALLWVVACLNYLDRQIIFSVFPLIRSEMRLDDFQLGLLSTVLLWVYGSASPFGGYLADRVGRKKVLILSLAIWTTVTLLTGVVRDLPQLLAARALMGLSEACYLPAALALIADLHGKDARSLATGLHHQVFTGVWLSGAGSAVGGANGMRGGRRSLYSALWAMSMLSFWRRGFAAKQPPGAKTASQRLPGLRRSWRFFDCPVIPACWPHSRDSPGELDGLHLAAAVYL